MLVSGLAGARISFQGGSHPVGKMGLGSLHWVDVC